MSKALMIALWCGAGWLLAGCGGGNIGTVRSMFAEDFDCAESKVNVTSMGQGLYQADGCGKSSQYALEGQEPAVSACPHAAAR